MTWTYDVSNINTSVKDQVRFIVGDTLAKDPQLQDEELLFALTQRSSIWGTAAMCCESLAAQYSRRADTVTGELHTLYSAQSKAYAARALFYENKAVALSGATPYAGGISVTDKVNQAEDPDRVPPQFQIGQDDNYIPVAPSGPQPVFTGGDGGNVFSGSGGF